MWNHNLRPYAEYFAKAQAVTATAAIGNQSGNNPLRLENAQGGTAIRVAAAKGASLTVPAGATLTLTVEHGEAEAGSFSVLGTAVFTGPAGGTVFGPDAAIAEFVLPSLAGPFVRVKVGASAALSGSVDIFPMYLSRG